MHWVIQENLYREEGIEELHRVLGRLDLPYSVHKVVPFVGELIPDINPDGNVIVIGSYSISRVARAKGWTPGFYDIMEADFRAQNKPSRWKDHLLNAGAIVKRFGDNFYKLPDEFFIRPLSDSKSFAGTIMTRKEFRDWRNRIIDLKEDDGSTVDRETMIMIAKPKPILSEHRFWIVDGKVVTGSQYKIGGRVVYSSDADPKARWFAAEMAERWEPAKAYVMDVAIVPRDKCKIIEINNINSAGLYAANVGKLVEALEDLNADARGN